MATYREAEELALIHLGDTPDGKKFPTDVLLPIAKSVYRKIQRRLAENGVSVLKSTAEVTVTAVNQVAIGASALPSDLVVPLRLWEKPTADGNAKFVPMAMAPEGLPDMEPGGVLRYWEWLDNEIRLIGATQQTTVKILYEKRLPDLDFRSPADRILIRDGLDALAAGMAAYANFSAGEGSARNPAKLQVEGAPTPMFQVFNDEIETLINSNVRLHQRRSRRRKPYGWRTHAARRGHRNVG